MLAGNANRAAVGRRIVTRTDENAGDASEHRNPEYHDDEQQQEPSPEVAR